MYKILLCRHILFLGVLIFIISENDDDDEVDDEVDDNE
jgi:hypothetical protein